MKDQTRMDADPLVAPPWLPSGPDKDSKNSKLLPAKKVSSAKQFEILKAFCIASTASMRPVSIKDISKLAGVHLNSVSICNPFFVETGLLLKSGHKFTPAKELYTYSEKLKWDNQEAGKALAPILIKTWFSAALLPLLQMREMSVDKAISALGEASGNGPECRAQLSSLLDFLLLAEIIEITDDIVKAPAPREMSSSSSAHNRVVISEQRMLTGRRIPKGLVQAQSENRDNFEIPIPDRESAKFSVPKGLTVDDWEMLKTMIDAYVLRMQKQTE